jgi:hypothetical protein
MSCISLHFGIYMYNFVFPHSPLIIIEMYFYLYWHIAQMNGSSPERRHHSDSSSKFAHCRWYQREHKLQHIQSSPSIHAYALLQMAQFSSLSSDSYSLFPFSFFRYRCSRISISRRKGFRN